MLFYESAKCLHGRMTEFKGKYYGSIFLHYQPVDKVLWPFTVQDVIESVPPHWNIGLVEESGSRWAGQAITTDDRVAIGAPPRIISNMKKYEEYMKEMETKVFPEYGSNYPIDNDSEVYGRILEEDEETNDEIKRNENIRRNRLLELQRPPSRSHGKIPRGSNKLHSSSGSSSNGKTKVKPNAEEL